MTSTLQWPPYRAVFFDAGMTLIRPVNTVERIYAHYAGSSGIPLEELVPQLRRHFGELFEQAREDMATGGDGYVASDAADHEMWRRLCFTVAERIPGLTDDPQAWFEALYGHFGEPTTWQPFEEVAETLSGLKAKGIQLGVISNWDSRLVAILEGLGLSDIMDTVLVSAREGVRKPSPRIFELALERLGLEPHQALMVGDSVIDDVQGAQRAGLTGVLIHRGRGDPPQGIHVVRSLTELLSPPG